MTECSGAPLVSVGLPVYNGAAYVAEAIQSVLDQTLADLELIVSDNASTDETPEICQGFADRDQRVRFIRNHENRGAAPNYNLTLLLARGPYFKWLAHDDVLRPDFIRRCVDVLETDPTAILAYPTPVDIDSEGRELGLRDAGLEITDPEPEARFRRILGTAHACLPVFGVVRTDVLRRTGQHGNYPSADRVLLSELTLYGRLVEVPEELYLHREHPERFVYTHRSVDDQVRWMDTSRGGGRAYPTWRRLREHLRSIVQAPIVMTSKVSCTVFVAKWAIRSWPQLVGDITTVLGLPVGRQRLEASARVGSDED